MARARRSSGPAAEPFRHGGQDQGGAALALAGGRLDEDRDGASDLMETIEAEVIPRLLLAHRVEPRSNGRCAEARLPPTEDEVGEFARIAACHDLPGALAFVELLCRQGLSLEMVLLHLVAPAARLLGEQWKADLRSFTEVSAGLGTLQQVVHVLGPSFAPTLPHRGLVVLVAAPGEQHTLGLYLVGEFLRRAGWGVQVAPDMSRAELIALLSSEQAVMLGITVSNSALLKPLSSLIAAARKASRNRGLPVMLGGPIDLEDFAARNGALLCAPDPRETVRWLEEHVSRN
jgi:methanogenic corrinoid protein MtbC1